jgi:hypothetical protein
MARTTWVAMVKVDLSRGGELMARTNSPKKPSRSVLEKRREKQARREARATADRKRDALQRQ